MRDASDVTSETVHGTCVTLGRTAALIRGPSGSGKSDLALRFLFLARRAPAALEAPMLVADDQVVVTAKEDRLEAKAPPALEGKLEVRGVGIVEVKWAREADIVLVVDLVASDAVERMPEPRFVTLLGVKVPQVQLTPFEASAPIKLAAAITMARKLAG